MRFFLQATCDLLWGYALQTSSSLSPSEPLLSVHSAKGLLTSYFDSLFACSS